MLLVDSNVWIALSVSDHLFHSRAHAWFHEQTAQKPAMFCRATQQSFLRLLTTDAVFAPFGIPALGNKAAWSVYETLRADKRISWVAEPSHLEIHWKRLCSGSKASPKLWMDAYLAAFAITGSFQLVTIDKAFRQFKGIDLLVLG